MAVPQPTGVLSRPLDLIYLVYFVIHIPITLGIDGQALYPPLFVPKGAKSVLKFYIDTYKDPLMGSPIPLYWFLSFITAELTLQLPFFFYAIYGLYKVYSAHVATTVLATLSEVLLNPLHPISSSERLILCVFYLPYFVLPLVMLVDSYRRVSQALVTVRAKTD
ncbi:transmembrane protein 6/97 [Spinellus fusiger]|nr:transmembrane protein 6/97 [Spinellus fusiger]